MKEFGPLMNNEDYRDESKGGALDKKIKGTGQSSDGNPNQSGQTESNS